MIARLWLKRRHQPVPRVLWSFVLLVPILGLLAFFFLTENPDERPYESESVGIIASNEDAGGRHDS